MEKKKDSPRRTKAELIEALRRSEQRNTVQYETLKKQQNKAAYAEYRWEQASSGARQADKDRKRWQTQAIEYGRRIKQLEAHREYLLDMLTEQTSSAKDEPKD